jgi:hypothetical protein
MAKSCLYSREQIVSASMLFLLPHSLYGMYIQSDSLARGPKLLSIKNYVIEIMA